jgi:sulfatase maturation enzyme AslB (radical SAM superfamily)
MNKSFCVHPWINISVDPNGSIKPCCISTDSIKKADGKPYNLGYDKIEDFYNSPDYVEIRRKMLAGELVDGCSQCYQLEKYGKESKRLTINRIFADQLTPTETVVKSNIAYFDLRFGNLCNLKCRSCMPLNSSQLDKQAIDYPELKRFYGVLGYSINDWYETETFDQNLDSSLKHIRILYITGGEPTLIKKNFELLEKLINEGYSKNIWLSINSNLTNDKTTFFDLLSEFKNVTFSASIDGYGNTQEYLRYPSNWKQIDKNIHRLVDRTASNIDIKIQPVVQIGNLGSITELFEYAESFNRVADKPVVNLYLNILENPNYLDLLYLPLEYKIECWNRIETWVKDKCKYQLPLFYSQLETLKNKCFTDIDYKKTLTTFFEFNELLDNVQHIKLVDVNPELYSLKNKYLGENNE